MDKNSNITEEQTENIDSAETAENEETENAVSAEQEEAVSEEERLRDELESIKDRYMRTAAEYDNFKKRTSKEKEELYSTAVCDTISDILPILDNIKRAVTASADGDSQNLADGVKMIEKQFGDVFSSLGIEEIEAVGSEFDPNLHNAVMHIDDESLGESAVVEEFMKGYTYKGRVIRHSMVKVAN